MKVDLERLRRVAKYVRFDGKPGPAVYGHELEALLAVVDAAQAMTSWDYVGDADPDVYGALRAALEPFTPRYDETSTLPTPGFNDARAWEEVDRWNAERDLAVKAAVDATKGNPRDRARDQLADAGVAVQRQFRSDQERIAALERECDLRAAESTSANELITEIKDRLARVPALVEALRRIEDQYEPNTSTACNEIARAALAEWEKP